MNYDEISEIFSSNETVKVVFTKKDGTERTMIATIKNIPEEDLPKTQTTYEDRSVTSNYRCYDVEAEGWRSFSISSVISIEGYLTK